MVGNQDAVSEKQEFDVFDDQDLNILAVGDLGKFLTKRRIPLYLNDS